MVSMDSGAVVDSCIPDMSYIDLHQQSIQCTCLIPVCVLGQLEQLGSLKGHRRDASTLAMERGG